MGKRVPQKVAIPGWPYYITIEGEVFRNGSQKPLKPIRTADGYTKVNLSHGGKTWCVQISSLMRLCYFGGTILPLRHLDGQKANCQYWNLTPVHRSVISSSIRRSRAVIETLPDGTENIYQSAKACAKAIYVDRSTILNWLAGRRKNTVNDNTYRWEDSEHE